MKFFFFNGQPLLLCCVCCKIAIQDFVTGLHKKQEKFTVSPTGTLTEYNPSVFHRELKNIYGIVPQSPTEYNPLVFHRELKKIYKIVPQSLTASPTAITRRYFTESWKTFTGLCHNHRRIHRRFYRRISPTDYAHPEAHACQTRVRLHNYRWIFL